MADGGTGAGKMGGGRLPEVDEDPGLVREFLLFLRHEKKWWLLPIILVLAALGAFLLFAQTSPLAPLLYPLF